MLWPKEVILEERIIMQPTFWNAPPTSDLNICSLLTGSSRKWSQSYIQERAMF